jgi:uncharacterized protein (TIGR03083 family)
VPTLAPSPRHRTVQRETAIDLLDGEVRRIAELIAGTAPTAPVPGTDWDLADLTGHVALLHRWVRTMVGSLTPRRIDQRRIELDAPKDWTAVPAWFSRNGADLVAVLRAADPQARMYSWAEDKHVSFWIRRMLHETTIHRTDAEAAAGVSGLIEPAVAVDGIDELLELLPYAGYFRPQVRELRGDGETIHLHATDLDAAGPAGGASNSAGAKNTGSTGTGPNHALPGEWLITLEPEGFRWSRAHVKGAVAVRGRVQDLTLFMYGRIKAQDRRLEVLGDLSLLAHWSANAAF